MVLLTSTVVRVSETRRHSFKCQFCHENLLGGLGPVTLSLIFPHKVVVIIKLRRGETKLKIILILVGVKYSINYYVHNLFY